MNRLSIYLFAFTILIFTTPVFAQESPTDPQAPAFFSSSMTQEDLDALTPEQKAELSTYLAQHALFAPGTVMEVSSVSATLDNATYTSGDTANVRIDWTSPMVNEYIAPEGGSNTLPMLSFSVSLTDDTDMPCAQPVITSVPVSDSSPSFPLTVTAPCAHPRVSVAIADWNNTSLGAWSIYNPAVVETTGGWTPGAIALGVGIVLVLGGLVFWRMRNTA